MSEEDALSARLLRYNLTSALETWQIQNHLIRVGQLAGFHNAVYEVVGQMPANNRGDYDNILARLERIPELVDDNIALLNESIELGITQPKIVVDLVANQLAAQIAQTAEQSTLLDAFREFPSNISKSDQDALRSRAAQLYNDGFLPAWRKLSEFITGKYAQNARPSIAATEVVGEKDAYGELIRSLTTTNRSPEEFHKLGMEEVERIEGEMRKIMDEAGFKGTIQEYEQKLDADPKQHFTSKEEMLMVGRDLTKRIEPGLPRLFKRIPLLVYGVRPITPDREASTADNAQFGSPDGSTPGWYNMNTYKPEEQVRYGKPALVLHETVPGHLFQGAIAATQDSLPEFRKFYWNSAYGEGWALYAESLGGELGVYDAPEYKFGQLDSERFRAVRWVVDSGMHAMGWSRDQAIAYFKEHAPSESFAEIDRYISWPAQALSYKTGQRKILELRKDAESALGEKFDIREFHDVVLRGGVLPIDLLEEEVRAYIAETR